MKKILFTFILLIASYSYSQQIRIDGVGVIGGGGGASLSDVAYPTGWDGDTTQGASRNAIYDAIISLTGGGIGSLLEDTTPQLGGNLDLNTFSITGMVIGTDIQAYSAVLQATTASFLIADESKLDAITGTNTGDQTAVEVPFTNTTSGMAATDVQAAIDEVEARVDTNDAKVTNTDAQDLTLTVNTLAISGDPNTDVDLSGYLDNTDSQNAAAVPITDVGTYFVATDVEGALQELGAAAGGGEATTVSDTGEIDLTLTTFDITADIVASSIDETKLDVSTNASLDLADSALQSLNGVVTGNITDGTIDILDLDAALQTSVGLADTSIQSLNGVTSANITNGEIDELDLDVSVNASLDLADSAAQIITAQASTGTTIDLSDYYQYNMAAASSFTGAYTTTGAVAGGFAECLVNAATEPTITGATKLPNTATFIASTDMVMNVKAFGSTVKYWFTEF